jgi:phosphoserine phosphatase RsbU/P
MIWSNQATGRMPLTAARVLVVDDNRVNRHLLSALLERAGVGHIEHAADGLEGLAKLEAFPADLILLDLMMPNMDGFEMCRLVRADPRWADVPVLVQSSLSRAEDRSRAFSVGATDYVSKPLNASELVARSRIHLENRALLRDLQAFHKRTEAELALAWRMQERLLPTSWRLQALKDEGGLKVASRFVPSSELGGDIWDFRYDDHGRPVVFVADFSGHGVGAALNTFRLHTIIQQMDLANFSPAAFLAQVNERLTGLLQFGQFATMLVGVFDYEANAFHYASAGSTKPMVWLPGQETPVLGESAGLPLGLSPTATYDEREMLFPVGGRLMLYSDAAIEIPVDDDVLDDGGLARVASARLSASDAGDDERFLDEVIADLRDIGEIDDDLTMVLIRRER